MKPICKTLQDRLAGDGPGALRDDTKAQRHLADCAECFAFLERLSALEADLSAMPPLDVADHVVEALLERPEIAAGVPSRPAGTWSRILAAAGRMLRPRPFLWAGGAAAAVLLVFAVSLHQRDMLAPRSEKLAVREKYALKTTEPVDAPENVEVPRPETLRGLGYLGDKKELGEGNRVFENARTESKNEIERRKLAQDFEQRQRAGAGDYADLVGPEEAQERLDVTAQSKGLDPDEVAYGQTQGSFYRNQPGGSKDGVDDDGRSNADAGLREAHAKQSISKSVLPPPPPAKEAESKRKSNRPKPPSRPPARATAEVDRLLPAPPGAFKAGTEDIPQPRLIADSHVRPDYPEPARTARLNGQVALRVVVGPDGRVGAATVLRCTRPNVGFEAAASAAVLQWRYEPVLRDGKAVSVYFDVIVDFDPAPGAEQGSLRPQSNTAVAAARRFFAERESFDGLSLKPASGYWANTYVPGDPTLRLLQSRLGEAGRTEFESFTQTTLQLHDASRPAAQPFDVPATSALGVFLHADRRGLAGEGRMLLQVGLKGTPRHGGRRPAMNLAVVLDMRGAVSTDVAIRTRALVDALNQAKSPGDRFRLALVDETGLTEVRSDDFRHGYLKITLDRLLAEDRRNDRGHPDLVAAVADAIRGVAGADDPETPLGTSAVILATGQPLGEATASLVDMAHQSAVAGVPLSVIALDGAVDSGELERLALAGQGSRRLLDSAADAVQLVDRELSAASRAIARAVRLRIRLAPGVKLIDVLGSERLDETRAQQVRDAERSIDLRLSRNLGIEADRGDDEEGIQIVIPSFYAGDSHVVLLDVVAGGPGPIADVTARYKDLVYLRNGVTRAGLALGHEELAPGPLERNVLKNLLSSRLAETLERAGRALDDADRQAAARMLDEFKTLLTGLQATRPGLANDPDVIADVAMLSEYGGLLSSGLALEPRQMMFLSNSLHYAALLKLQPRPMETRT